jgi:hypothetical protein
MSRQSDEERSRLFAQEKLLREEGISVLEKSGIGEILREEDFHSVGSFVMGTMTWRDMDFERFDENPDWDRHWKLGQKLHGIDWIWSLHCNDAYRDPRNPGDSGHYWGLRASDPGGGEIWKIDLWTARKEEFESASPNRELWNSRLTDDSRYIILAIKDTLWKLPEYRQTLLSAHIYEAVLEHGISDIDSFWNWWNAKYGTKDAQALR